MNRSKRVAIVGFGPRGLHALERLIAHHRVHPQPIEVTIFEPHSAIGAGPVYDPRQPLHLPMNYPASKIGLAWPQGGPVSAYDGPDFWDWSRMRDEAANGVPRQATCQDPGQDPAGSRRNVRMGRFGPDRAGVHPTRPDDPDDWFPPRALVGEYLNAGARRLLDRAPFPLTVQRTRVDDIQRQVDAAGLSSTDPTWALSSAGQVHAVDEVLLAIGHRQPSSSPRIDDIAPSARVGVRGFGLTAVDLILSLVSGNGSPTLIAPFTRSGRPMLVKPDLAAGPVPPGPSLERSDDTIRRSSPGLPTLISALADLAADLLGPAITVGWQERRAHATAWLQAASRNLLPPDHDPASSLRRSLLVALGSERPGVEWALATAWREAYPAVVAACSHGGLPPSDRLGFRSLARHLERMSFGFPPSSGATLCDLVGDAVLTLDLLSGTVTDPDGGTVVDAHGRSVFVDVVLDSVIAGPGLDPRQPPLAGLAALGAIHAPEGSRGIAVDQAGRCLNKAGTVTPGLAAVGRLTEDWVIGNDTLSRSLHAHLDHWAASILAAAAKTGQIPAPTGPTAPQVLRA